jgi:hypothetical protein
MWFYEVRSSHSTFQKEKKYLNTQISPLMGCMPYGIANCVMAKYTTNENGEYMYVCTKCDKQQYKFYNTSYIVLHFPNYRNLMLCFHPIYVQLLSLIDIGLHIQEKHFGFSIVQINEKSLLNTPLQNWNGILEKEISQNEVMNIIMPMFVENINTNPLFK